MKLFGWPGLGRSIAVVSYLFRKSNVLSLAEGIRRQSGATQILFTAMHESWTAVELAIRCGVRGLLLDSDPPEMLISATKPCREVMPSFRRQSRCSAPMLMPRLQRSPNISDLTVRELEIFEHLSRGESNKTMAFQLNISVKTVEAHRAKLLKKLHVCSTVELVRWAVRQKLIQ